MTSSDIIAIAAHAVITEDDKFVLVWGNSEILESYYAEDAGEAKKKQQAYEKRTGLTTKLYVRVKE